MAEPHIPDRVGQIAAAPVTVGQVAAGLVCLIAYAYLAWVSQSYGSAGVFDLLPVMLIGAVVTGWLWWRYPYQGRPLSPWLVLGFALLFRLLGMMSFPVLEDDFYRYLWDGRMVVETGNPYLLAPAEFFAGDGVAEVFDEVLDGINYPGITTVYGPVAQWAFAFAYWLAPAQVWPLQCLFGLADFAVVLLLWRMAPLGWVLLYAWSPLLIKEFAFTAHLDVLGVLFLTAALWAYQRRWVYVLGLSLGLAAGVKVFALIVAPFLIGWRWRAALVMLAVMLLVAWPFGLQNAWLPGGLQVMGDSWLFNAPLYLSARPWLTVSSFGLLKTVLLGAFVVLWGWYYLRWMQQGWVSINALGSRWQPLSSVPLVWLWGAFWLVTPVLNPWYLVWWLPFAVLRPALTPWVASVSLLLSYLTGINLEVEQLGLYEIPGWVLALEFASIGTAMLYDFNSRAKKD